MKNTYPNYNGKGVASVRNELPKKEKIVLANFLNYCRITAGERKIKQIERIMLQIYDVMEISYSAITIKDLRDFLSVLNQSDKMVETQNDIKKVLKRFLKWFYQDWNKRFIELRDIRTRDGMNHKKLNASTILKKDEIEILIRCAESLRHKALVILLFESAARPEEIRNLRWRDIDLNRNEVTLNSSKTKKTRVNPIHESILHLKRYKQEFPFPSVATQDYVFPSPQDRGKPISEQALTNYFKKLGHRSLGKSIFPYLLRHSRLTQIYKTLPSKIAEKFAGHSAAMSYRYVHLDNDDVRNAMLEKIYHIEEIDQDSNEKLEKRIAYIENEMKIIRSFLTEVRSIMTLTKETRNISSIEKPIYQNNLENQFNV